MNYRKAERYKLQKTVLIGMKYEYYIYIHKYEGWNFNSGNYLFTTDTKWIHVSKCYCPSM